MHNDEIFGCNYADLESVIRTAKQLHLSSGFAQFIVKYPNRKNYNITMNLEKAKQCGAKIIWSSNNPNN